MISRRKPQPGTDPRFPDDTRITIRIETELFELIWARSVEHNVYLSEECRMLLEWGLDAATKGEAKP